MTATDWEEVKTIFTAALEICPEDRGDFVRHSCESRTDLNEMVLDLLNHHSDSSDSNAIPNQPAKPVLAPDELVAGRFRVKRLIAAGGMGEVYEARDEWLRLDVALKTVRPELLADPGALDRFKHELLVARTVSHENVCRVFDFVEHRPALEPASSTPCFTMELLQGETLAQVLTRRRPLPCAEALPMLKQIAAGLGVLHDQGIVHRDLKPSNIMIVPLAGRPDRVVVMDFGLAKSDPVDADWSQSAAEFRGGAPYFMAPEILRKVRPAISSDIYSFGLLIDDMVTNSRAFSSISPEALCWEKLWQKPALPSTRSSQLPPHWEAAILRCLESDPAARPASVREVIDALETTEAPALPAVISQEKTSFLTRRRLLAGAAIGVPAAAATVVTALALQTVTTSIEVNEIRNTTGLADYDYLCKGTTAELTRQLLQLERLRVFSPRPSLQGPPAPTGARFSLDGMLQAHNGRIRFSVKLSDNQSGAVLWSENFDEDGIGDPLTLQSNIARNTVTAIERQALFGGESERPRSFASAAFRLRNWLGLQTGNTLAAPPTRSSVAFDLYMRGHHLLEDLSASSASAAIDYFKRAIQNDQQFALAYSAASDAYMALMNYSYAPHPELARNARYYAERAVELDRNLAEAHSVLAAVRQMDWDRAGAEQHYREALRLKPNFARARRWYAGFVLQFDRTREAIAESRRALELDPYDASAAASVGLYLFFSGMYGEAIELMRASLLKKDMLMTRHNLGQVYAWLGKTTSGAEAERNFGLALEQCRAIEVAERVTFPDGRTPFADQLFALAYSLHGREKDARIYLARLESDVRSGGTSPVIVAWIYAILGERDRACDELERAASWRDRKLLYARIIPFLTNLHGFPRFEALLAHMNLV